MTENVPVRLGVASTLAQAAAPVALQSKFTEFDVGATGISSYSILMQIRASVLNDLSKRIPPSHYQTRPGRFETTIYPAENLDKIRHVAIADHELAKQLAEENDNSQAFTPREVSATEVLRLVGYYLMFHTLSEAGHTQRTPVRRREASRQLIEALKLYALHLNDVDARLIAAALAVPDIAENAVTELLADQSGPSKADSAQSADPDEAAPDLGSSKIIQYDLLATRDQLLDAFQSWGLQPAWFKDLRSHSWLKAARTCKGQGQRGHVVEPLFCPYAVMIGLVNHIRGRTRMSPEKGWEILERRFPLVYGAKAIADPRDRPV